MTERTFLMVKPDGVQRGLMGEIMKRFEQKGFKMIACTFTVLTREQAEFHYAEHSARPFFGELVDFITSGPVLAMVWEGENVIQISRAMIGKTKAVDMVPGTIRGDLACSTGMNLIHGSDSVDSAAREMLNVFYQDEIISYVKSINLWT